MSEPQSIPKYRVWLRRAAAPWVWLVMGLIVTGVLSVLPSRWTAPARQSLFTAIEPGQRAVGKAQQTLSHLTGQWQSTSTAAEPVAPPKTGNRWP